MLISNFLCQNIEIKKNIGIQGQGKVKGKVRDQGREQVKVQGKFQGKGQAQGLGKFSVSFRVLAILPIFIPYFKFFLIKSAFRALILSYFFISDHILSFQTRKTKKNSRYIKCTQSETPFSECLAPLKNRVTFKFLIYFLLLLLI